MKKQACELIIIKFLTNEIDLNIWIYVFPTDTDVNAKIKKSILYIFFILPSPASSKKIRLA